MSKVKKYNVTTQLSGLFGENYKEHIQVGKKFWWLFDGNDAFRWSCFSGVITMNV